jgi:hypothetical protein
MFDISKALPGSQARHLTAPLFLAARVLFLLGIIAAPKEAANQTTGT